MTVNDETASFSYAGNGSTVDFNFSNELYEEASVAVQVSVDTSDFSGAVTDLILDDLGPQGYTVALASDFSSAVITVNTAPASGETITIYRNQELTQPDSYQTGGQFPAKSHERGLDREMTAAQSVRFRNLRVPYLPAYVGPQQPMDLEENPSAQFVIFNRAIGQYQLSIPGAINPGDITDGSVSTSKLANNAVTTTKLEDLDAYNLFIRNTNSSGDPQKVLIDSVRTLSTGSTTRRSLGDRFAEIANPLDFGATGDGVADDTTALNTAMATGATSIFINKNIRITSEVVVPATVQRIYGPGKITCDTPADSSGLLIEVDDVTIEVAEMVPPPQFGTTFLSNAAIEFHNAKRGSVRGVTFARRGTLAAEGHGIVMWGCDEMIIDGVRDYGNGVNYDDAGNTQLNADIIMVAVWQSGNNITVSNCQSDGVKCVNVQSDKGGLEFGDISGVNVTNCICNNAPAHGFTSYLDNIGFPANFIRDIQFNNCQMVNGTGKLYNSSTGIRIYGIGFYNQGAYQWQATGCIVRNSCQNTNITPTNPIPTAAIASTNGSVGIVNCTVEDCPVVPALNINAQRDQTNIYDGRILVDGLLARNVHQDTEDAAIRIIQGDDVIITNCIVDNYDGTGIKIDATGAADETESTADVTISNCIIKNGQANSTEAILVDDCNRANVTGNQIHTVDGDGIEVLNCGLFNIAHNTITNWNRSGGTDNAIRVAAGSPAEVETDASSILGNCMSLISGTGRGINCALKANVTKNSFDNVALLDQYPNTYGEQRTSADSATPNVDGCEVMRSSSGSTTTITDFDGGRTGQKLAFIQESGARTINHGTGIITKSAANVSLVAPATINFVLNRDGNWYEI